MGHSQGDHIPAQIHVILWATILHPQTQQTFSAGTHVEEDNVHFFMDIDSLERRPTQQKVERQGKGDKISNNVLES